ncbi:LysM peptidoglycan-binding domain-containing protein, partial [Anaerolinea thermolimosa]
MTRKPLFLCILLGGVFALGLALAFTAPARASLPGQAVYQTPTPDAQGRILYKVQSGDSCLRIELLTGVKVEQLRTLNKLNEACDLIVGQDVLLAIVTPAPTATPALET